MGFRLRDDFEIRRDNANNRTVVENLNTGNTFILNDDGSFDATQVNGQIGDSSNRSDVYGDSVDADDQTINNSVTYPDGTTITTSPSELWSEDGNSSKTETGVSSSTFSLSNDYDIVKVIIQIEDVSGDVTQPDLRANGDSGNNYSWVKTDGTTSSGSEVQILHSMNSNNSVTFIFECDGRWNNEWTGGLTAQRNLSGQAVGFLNNNISSPLDSLTILADSNFDITWEVYGRNVGASGNP